MAEAEAEADDAQKEALLSQPAGTAGIYGAQYGYFDFNQPIPCHQAPTSSVAQSVVISEAGVKTTGS